MSRMSVLEEVHAERCRQDAKWGQQDHPAGKVAEAFAEDDPALLRAELIHAAAVAVAWVEAIDRRAGE